MIGMEKILEKLKTVEYKNDSYWYKMDAWDGWSHEEQLALLKIYSVICEKEAHIYDLVYHNQGVDSWEDIFRDYSVYALEDKAIGVQMAVDEMMACSEGDEGENLVDEVDGEDVDEVEDLVDEVDNVDGGDGLVEGLVEGEM